MASSNPQVCACGGGLTKEESQDPSWTCESTQCHRRDLDKGGKL